MNDAETMSGAERCSRIMSTIRGERRGECGRKRRRDESSERLPDKISNNNEQNIEQQSSDINESSGLPIGLQGISGESRNSSSGYRKPIASLFKGSEIMEQQYAEGEEERCGRILRVLQNSTGRYLSDVVACSNHEKAKQFASRLQDESGVYRRGFMLISVDKNHVHIVHDCSYSNGTCRCSFIQKTEIMHGQRRRIRSGRSRPNSNTIKSADIKNILHYFDKEPRSTYFIKIGGLVERLPRRNKVMEEQRSSGCEGLEGQTEQNEEEDPVPLFGEQYQHDAMFGPDRKGCEAVSITKRRKVGNKQVRRMEKMIDLMKKYPMSPVEAITRHRVWLMDNELKFLNQGDRDVKAALKNWSNQLVTWSMKDFNDLYNNPDCKPIFSAGYGNIDNYYYSIDRSVDVLEELIKYQCNEDDEMVELFLTDLYNVLERVQPKLNTLVIFSPPSSGKNYFFDAIKDFYINCGHLCNANKYNSFPFQDADCRRLILWNEPNYSPEFLEPIKEILGGDSTSVNVKYMADSPIYRTPVLVLTNRIVSFMHHIAFKDRLKVYNWKAAPYLAEYNKKPHPLATIKLFERFGLIKVE